MQSSRVFAYHRFGRLTESVGGAPLGYEELTRILETEPESHLIPHDLHSLVTDYLRGDDIRAQLPDDATIVCTCGPYAQFYFYLREAIGGSFRIIRDVRTACWKTYLLQESLCRPLERPGDVLVVLSHYLKRFLEGKTPSSIDSGRTVVAYPIRPFLPRRTDDGVHDGYRVGYLGRISADKNTRTVLKVAAELQRRRQDVEIHMAGPFYPAESGIADREQLHIAALASSVNLEKFVYHGDLPYEQVGPYLSSIDVLYFPATSSHETYGRVIAEATAVGVPVIAADFAAARELLPAGNLVPVEYSVPEWVPSVPMFSFGRPNLEQSVQKLLDPIYQFILRPVDEVDYYRRAVLDGQLEPNEGPVAPSVDSFLDRLEVSDLPFYSPEQARTVIKDLMPLFSAFHGDEYFPDTARTAVLTAGNADHVTLKLIEERYSRPDLKWQMRMSNFYSASLGFDPKYRFR